MPVAQRRRTNRDLAIRLVLALVVLVLVGWGLGAFCRAVFNTADLRLVRDIASNRTSAMTTIARAVSFIGSGWVMYPLTLACSLGLYRSRQPSWAIAVALSTAGAVVVANVDRVLVGRPRPPVRHLQAVTGQSFPSGHATHSSAFLVAVTIALFALPMPRALKILAASVSSVLALLIAYSRVYLGVHYPTDAVFGLLLGATWAVLACRYRPGSVANHAD